MTGKRPSSSFHLGNVGRPKLADYQEKYGHILKLERTDGILVARYHSDDGVFGSTGWFNVWHQAWWEIGNDPENEIIIITATGDRWINYGDPDGEKAPPRELTDFAQAVYLECLKNIEHVIFGLNVPTIGVIQAPAYVHFEVPLFCDLTLCADDVLFKDPHADFGMAAGDGLGMAYQHLLNPKQAAYYLYTSDVMDAETALRLGIVNEVLPKDKLIDRAMELARTIKRIPRLSRLMAKQIVRRGLQQRYVQDASFHMAHEMFGMMTDSVVGNSHSPEQVRASMDSFEAAIERKRKGR